jgi:hypothetical protein
MVGTDAIVSLAGGGVNGYAMTGQTDAQVTPATPGKVPLEDTELTRTGVTTVSSFTRKISADGGHPIDAVGLNWMIFALGNDDTFPQLHKKRCQLKIDFAEHAIEFLPPCVDPRDWTAPEVKPEKVAGCEIGLSWVMTDTEVTFTASVPGEKWLALAVADEGLMVGADAVIGVPGDGGGVNEYFLDGYSLSDVKLVTGDDGEQGVVPKNAAIAFQNGVTEMTWTRSFETDGIAKEGATTFLWASGATGSLAYHGENRGVTEITLSTNECVKGSIVVSVLKQVHGLLMGLGWGIIMPLAVIIARYVPSFLDTLPSFLDTLPSFLPSFLHLLSLTHVLPPPSFLDTLPWFLHLPSFFLLPSVILLLSFLLSFLY